MTLKALPPGIANMLCEGETDILTPRAINRAYAITAHPCPRCGGEMKQSLNPAFVFTSDEPLPRTVAECGDCGHTYDPHNGIILKMGDPALADDPFAIPGLD